MKGIVISDVLKQAWALTKKHWLAIVACGVITGIMFYAIFFLLILGLSIIGCFTTVFADEISEQMTIAESLFLFFVLNALAFALLVGFYQILLNCARGDGQFSFKIWKQPVNTYVKIVVTQIVTMILVFIGFILFILPGLYIAARLQFAVFYLLDHKEAGIKEAIKASWDMTEHDAFSIVGVIFACFGLTIVGILCCFVGAYVAAIVNYLTMPVCYLTLADGFKKNL
ncbi:MAG: hypothetical protein K6E73_12755 [Bacteroidales bacterium]|nr:hypothetical protein [Bacteroidales bacterium]